MKRFLTYLAFLPFFLATAFAAKVYLQKLLEQPAPPQPVIEIRALPPVAQIPAPTPVTEPVAVAPAPQPTHRVTNSSHKIQVALLLDVSSSMSGLIDQAKAKLWQVVNELSDASIQGQTPQLEIGLYIYGGSDLDPKTGYVKQLTALTTDLDLISERLFALGTSGGDEYCGTVIQTATQDLKWTQNKDDLRMVFIAGNEPFTQGGISFKSACDAAIEKDIVINTIFCGEYTEGVNTSWKAGADRGRGEYMNIDHNQQSVHISTPYDQQISQYNTQLNNTYYSYGARGAELKNRQMTQDSNAGKYGESNVASRAISKSKKGYVNSHWDLVDAYDNKKIKLESLKKDELPEALQEMNQQELEAKIQEASKERAAVQQKILELDKQRKAYIQKEQEKLTEENTLDQVLLKTVRSQAKQKNYTFE